MLNQGNKLNLPELPYGNTGWKLTVADYSTEALKIGLVDEEGERIHTIRITPQQLDHVFAPQEDEDTRDDLFATEDDAVAEEVLIAVVTEAKKGRGKKSVPHVELIDFYELALTLREAGQF